MDLNRVFFGLMVKLLKKLKGYLLSQVYNDFFKNNSTW